MILPLPLARLARARALIVGLLLGSGAAWTSPVLVLVLVLVVLLSSSLVATPVLPRLVLRYVLLLILIPASASLSARIATLPVPALIVVESTTTLVAALTPAEAGLVVLVSLRVLS